MSKKYYLYFVPPPVHGSSVVGKHIYDSKIINSTFDCKFINLNLSSSVGAIGKKSPKKIFTYFKIILKVFYFSIFFKPNATYLAITANGIGFYKDFVVVCIVKLFNNKYYCIFTTKEFQKCSINS